MTFYKKSQFSNDKLLINNLVFFSGMGRSGKTLLSKVLPSLKNFEQVDFAEFFENILAGVALNKVSFDFAKSFIITTFNELAYNKLLGRKLNFRSSDITSVKNFRNSNLYEGRLKLPEGDEVIKRLKLSRDFFPYMTHDLMPNFHLLKRMNFNFKTIQMYRNPFDVVFSTYKRGWGTRHLKDPRNFSLSIKYKNFLTPWYVSDFQKEWFNMNPVERCAANVLRTTNLSILNHKKNKNHKKILTISYENFVENTHIEISRICHFLKTKKTKFTKKALAQENCPKPINEQQQEKKRNFVQLNISKKLYEKLEYLMKNYKKNLYNLNT